MSWPTPQDYNEAIQNPSQNFEDPELAAGVPETTSLGLPRPITGNFASVYRLKCARRDWAVRCFWREYNDMQQRYAAISQHLAQARLPYTVGFEYLARGIKVQGKWYPVLKMEWVEGDLLIPYIEGHLHDSAAILRLAESWRRMVCALESAGVAHGDLQHGNVMVVGGNLKLVDYDGMYVPTLRGKTSHELGHQHYQHPARTAQDFAPGIDRFAGWVVYLSLLALGRHAELWTQLQAGDECLLLRKGDYEAPSASPGLTLLSGLGDAELRSLTDSFRVALTAGPGDVPPLSESPAPKTRSSTWRTFLLTPIRMLWPSVPPLSPSARQQSASGDVHALPAGGALAPSWLADHVTTADVGAAFGGPRIQARMLTGASAVVLLVTLVGEMFHALASPLLVAGWCLAVIGVNLGTLLTWFHRQPGVQAMKSVLRRERRARRSVEIIERRMRHLRRQDEVRETRASRRRTRCLSAKDKLELRAESETAEAAQVLGEKVRWLQDAKRELTERQQQEIAAALQTLQAGYVRHQLASQSLRAARITHVSSLLRLRLWAMGIRSAADVTSEGIATLRTLDQSAVHSIVAWRVEAEVQARRSIPRVLPVDQLDRFTTKYARERSRLETNERQAREAARQRTASIGADLQRVCAPLDERLLRIDAERRGRQTELARLLAECEQDRALALAQLARTQRELEPYDDLTFTRFLQVTLLSQ